MSGRASRGGCRLRELRQANGWRRVDVASAAGVGYELLSKIERGELATCTVGKLVAIAQACGVSAVDLVPGLGARPARGLLRSRGPGA